TVSWYLPDHQGTIRDVIGNDGSVQNHLRYDSFGRILETSNPTKENFFAYAGREWDVDAGLYNYRARWYDPAAGRFLSVDPAGFTAGGFRLAADTIADVGLASGLYTAFGTAKSLIRGDKCNPQNLAGLLGFLPVLGVGVSRFLPALRSAQPAEDFIKNFYLRE